MKANILKLPLQMIFCQAPGKLLPQLQKVAPIHAYFWTWPGGGWISATISNLSFY